MRYGGGVGWWGVLSKLLIVWQFFLHLPYSSWELYGRPPLPLHSVLLGGQKLTLIFFNIAKSDKLSYPNCKLGGKVCRFGLLSQDRTVSRQGSYRAALATSSVNYWTFNSFFFPEHLPNNNKNTHTTNSSLISGYQISKTNGWVVHKLVVQAAMMTVQCASNLIMMIRLQF